jgi:hypothetical protein
LDGVAVPQAAPAIRGTVLLVAFHFPPFRGSSGLQRTLRFAQYLPAFGWRPIVLSVDPRAYSDTTPSAQGNELPEGLEVVRAFGLDTARHLSMRGRYPMALALPDRWATWRYWAVRAARRIIRERNVSAIFSTFPIATAHRIGLDVARLTGLPWIAEFRDPMWQGDYPPEPRINDCWRQLEAEVFARAQRVAVVTPGAAATYRARFPQFDPAHVVLIENGYDEETFERAGIDTEPQQERRPRGAGPLTLLHSGIIYPSERDPEPLFRALAALRSAGAITPDTLRIVLRASGNESQYAARLKQLAIADIVQLEPPIPYLAALQEMLSVDGLLVLQGASCNAQIPAKLYEYLRAGRPILALTDPAGDTATTLRAAGGGVIARLDSQAEIERSLVAFLAQLRDGSAPRASRQSTQRYSRRAQSGELARQLDLMVEERR